MESRSAYTSVGPIVEGGLDRSGGDRPNVKLENLRATVQTGKTYKPSKK